MDNTYPATPFDPHSTAASAGAFIRRKREEKGLSLVDLAARTTVSSPQYLSTLEAGRVNVARSKHLRSIAAALDMTPEEQALLLGMQHAADGERPVVNVLQPVESDEFNLRVLAGETLLPCRVDDEVVIVDHKQRELERGRTYLLSPQPGDWTLAVCGADEDGNLSLLVGQRIYTPGRVALLGRVLHRGRNL